MTRSAVKPNTPFQVYFLQDDYNGGYRVRRDGWSNDQFEIISQEQFENLKANCKVLSIPLIDMDEEDCA